MKTSEMNLQIAMSIKNLVEQAEGTARILTHMDSRYSSIADRYATMVKEINAIVDESKTLGD